VVNDGATIVCDANPLEKVSKATAVSGTVFRKYKVFAWV
jgi:hypothetical protein